MIVWCRLLYDGFCLVLGVMLCVICMFVDVIVVVCVSF